MAKKPDRRELCEKLLALRLKHAKVFSEIDGLKAELIIAAGAEGFREVFFGQGPDHRLRREGEGVQGRPARGRCQCLPRAVRSQAAKADRRWRHQGGADLVARLPGPRRREDLLIALAYRFFFGFGFALRGSSASNVRPESRSRNAAAPKCR
jgi:hypothetical protein